jgi:hypothetical protein
VIHSDNSDKTFIVHYLHCPHCLPLNSLPAPLKAIARSFLVLINIGIWTPSTIYCHLNLLPSPSPYPPHCTYFAVDVERGVSMYGHCGYTLLWSIQSLPLLSLTPLPPNPHFSTAFSIYPYIFYLHILRYAILLMLYHSLFLSLFPEFPRVVPLSQTCSTYEFVYDHACFCVCVYLWIYLPRMRENVAFVFLILAYFT